MKRREDEKEVNLMSWRKVEGEEKREGRKRAWKLKGF
jgi:hypothetical protein